MGRFRGQISTEYLILIGFIMFVVISLVGFSLLYSSEVRERIKFSEIASFANAIISHAEEVYYAGEPSKVTITPYLPTGVEEIEVLSDGIKFNVTSSGGRSVVVYPSNVPLSGSLSSGQGARRISITARTNDVLISEAS